MRAPDRGPAAAQWRPGRPSAVRPSRVRGHGHAAVGQPGHPDVANRRLRARSVDSWQGGRRRRTVDGAVGPPVGAVRAPARRPFVRRRH